MTSKRSCLRAVRLLALFWCSHSSLVVNRQGFLQLYCEKFWTTERLIIQLEIWRSLNPIPSNLYEISGIQMKRVQLTARTSLQGGEIPLGVIASIVKTRKISRRENVFAAKRLTKP